MLIFFILKDKPRFDASQPLGYVGQPSERGHLIMKTITVNSKKHGVKEILVDDEDYEMVSTKTWTIHRGGNNFYASTTGKGRKPVALHRFIMGDPPKGHCVDHKNRNGLDNRRENLRFASSTQNGANRAKVKGASSKYIGVYRGFSTSTYRKLSGEVVKYRSERWRVCVGSKMHGKKSFGSFKSEEEAARAYDKKALEMWGEFANLNFPPLTNN